MVFVILKLMIVLRLGSHQTSFLRDCINCKEKKIVKKNLYFFITTPAPLLPFCDLGFKPHTRNKYIF